MAPFHTLVGLSISPIHPTQVARVLALVEGSVVVVGKVEDLVKAKQMKWSGEGGVEWGRRRGVVQEACNRGRRQVTEEVGMEKELKVVEN